ncbi:MAG: DUF2336 domain-containing protein, partial [Rhodospirillales bacterium]|nr:DUF2336 domain-containing protein [Rhodospirillales bacterium]
AQEDPRVGSGGRSDSVPVAVRVNPDEKAIEAARRMRDLGALDESLICEAIQSQDTEFVLAAVAVRADVPISLVRLVVATHSAKGSVALAWRSGLSMTFAVSFQTLVAHVPAADTIRPKAGALYPLTAEEMRTYLDVLGLKGAKA